MSLKFIPATVSHIPLIIELAHKIWHQHYPEIITLEQIDYMLRSRYNAEKIESGMINGELFYLAEEDGDCIGFGSIEYTDAGWFLHKFYLLATSQRQGTGTVFFNFLLKEINHQTIRLQVNRQNIKAINFYFKNGFVIERAADFDIGNGYYMNDFVMVRKSANQ